MSSQEDLLAIQQRLKKTILDHQIAVSKLRTDPQNSVIKNELHELQTSIKTLSEEQKNIIQNLQQIVLKEKTSQTIESNNNQNLENGVFSKNHNLNNCNKSETHLKPIISRSALIIPQLGSKQSAAINASIKRPALAIKSITGQTQFLVPVANSSMKNKVLVVPKQRVFNYLKPVVKTLSSEASIRCTQTAQQVKTSSTAQPLHSTSILIRSNHKSPKVSQIKSFTANRVVPKPTDKQTKDHFMLSLGLVTKETLTELQSRKCERKRRTTANPQFSSAALEAKRITKLELAERKAKRRLLINPNTTNNDSTNTNATQSKTTYLNNNGSNPKSIGVEQQEISAGVHIVTSIGKQLSANCYVCDELCECDCDSILFCKPCKTLFHATCTTTKADITQNKALPKCPKCDVIRKKTVEKLTKKREERDNLLAKKREFDEQMAQMRRALNNLKLKLREKSEEKVSLVGKHEIVQQKVDKIIETLKLVEDTSEWEDGFAAALEATAPKARKSPEEQPEEEPTEEEEEPNEAEMEAMDVETSKATEQLEQLNRKEENNSLELGNEENEMYELECHENGAEIYDIFVEEVQENVDMVSDGVGFFDTEEPTEQHLKGHEFSQQEEHQVMLY